MKPTAKQMKQNAPKAVRLLKALAHADRLMILCHLLQGEHCVGELCSKSDLSQSAFSQHLAKLRRDGLVKTRKQAQTIYYSLANEDGIQVLKALQKLYC